MNTRLKIALLIVALAITAGTSDFAAAQFPNKPIRILVTAAAGGNLDVLARAVAEPMSKTLGQPVIVENMTGAGGLIAIRRWPSRPRRMATPSWPRPTPWRWRPASGRTRATIRRRT